ncbi:hypothetical protein A2851_00815 [Candidatus Kaiserbacteria bacterium RIFCSPHIGHO2_01_FULL_53_29]|uniref:Uncharacterized protein n=1 Tax=Candidatus Kaiserbacteria bacterium RIFCSPHIGHO2_01_FULL_53_29 TaxID=1798480 RepID=A0A1F6CYD6_9BACT|nr:MAG: hypothetical protein A2851_00815 [Candidatus Kaiserbacteria bacterium RIFCSPHIGHO2_01_FULL_53_29]
MDEKNILALQCIRGNSVAELTPLQLLIEPYADIIVVFWWILWISVVVYICIRIIAAYVSARDAP